VFVFGGCGDANCTSVLGTAEVYDPASDAWTGISSSGFTARRNPAAIPLNGKKILKVDINTGARIRRSGHV